MPRVLRTKIRPFLPVVHECRDEQGNRVEKTALSNTLCRQCDTQIVYVWDNTPTKPVTRGKNGR